MLNRSYYQPTVASFPNPQKKKKLRPLGATVPSVRRRTGRVVQMLKVIGRIGQCPRSATRMSESNDSVLDWLLEYQNKTGLQSKRKTHVDPPRLSLPENIMQESRKHVATFQGSTGPVESWANS